MVVDLLADDERIDRVFHALADRTRRDILREAMDGSHSVSALARRYPMSVAAVQKHVAVLADAGLVARTRRGRESLVQTQIETVVAAHALLDQLESLWQDRIDRIGELLAEEPEETP